jgi:hypothetical protein
MSIGIMAMHKFGGFKFAGLDKNGVKAYEEALKAFNDKVKAGEFTDKASYKAAKKLLKEKLGAKNIKNPIVKLLHKLALFVNMGNQRIKLYHSASKANMNWFRFIKNSNIIGVPLRFAIPLLVISPFIAKNATKLTHMIFGRPTKSVLDEDSEDETDNAKAAQEMVKPQSTNSQTSEDTNLIKKAAQEQHQMKNPNEYQSDTNLIKKAAEQQQQTPAREFKGQEATNNTTNGANKPVRTYIPSPECKVQAGPNDAKKELEPTRTYIPSPQGMVQKDPDMTAAEKALAQADMAEKYVNETLASINKN